MFERHWLGHWYLIEQLDINRYSAVHYYYINKNTFEYDSKHIESIEIYNNEYNKINLPQKDLFRFWSKVNLPKNLEDCWEWPERVDHDGYGKFSLNSQPYSVHRLVYKLY